jgi:hypothetical protein
MLDWACDSIEMALPGDAIENDAGEAQRRIEAIEPAHDRGRAAGDVGRIDHQNDRRAEQLGELRRASCFAASSPAVKQPHHPLDDGDVGSSATSAEQLQDGLSIHHPGVEVARYSAGCSGVVGRIDVIGSRLEWLHDSRRGKRRHDPAGDGRLAASALYAGDHDSMQTRLPSLRPAHWFRTP